MIITLFIGNKFQFKFLFFFASSNLKFLEKIFVVKFRNYDGSIDFFPKKIIQNQ